MSNLIKNELIKIFKKKTIYIALIVIFLFLIFMNCMFKFSSSYNPYVYSYSEDQIQYLKEELAALDPKKPSDISMYIDLKTQIDTSEYMNKYDEDAWQRQIIGTNLSGYIQERNTYQYGSDKDETKVEEINREIDSIIERLNQDDWKYFAQTELNQANERLKQLEEQKNNTEDKQQIQNIETEIANTQIQKEIAQYRIDKNIKYGSDYLNSALTRYETASQEELKYKDRNIDDLEFAEKKEYNEAIKDKEESKYIIENEVDAQNSNSLKGILEDFYNQFGLFMIVVIVMIAGTIVSDEFNKGTIKLLLIKPYSRAKVLLSKFITTMMIIVVVIAITILMQVLVGGIMYGFDSLSIPVIQYNFNTQSVQTMNIFAYVGLQTLTQLPMIILLATLAFAISTIFANSALAITIALLGYMSTMVINQLVISYNLDFMKYFVTMNWDLSPYLFGGLPYMQGMSLTVSVLVNIAYFVIMIIPIFVVFKKKNIKNI